MHARLNVAIGPNASVTGANTTPRPITDVFHIELTPIGASMYFVWNGFSPWVSAYGVQLRNQMNRPGSNIPPPSVRVPKCGRTSRQNTRLRTT